jgi:hypothetical protein
MFTLDPAIEAKIQPEKILKIQMNKGTSLMIRLLRMKFEKAEPGHFSTLLPWKDGTNCKRSP